MPSEPPSEPPSGLPGRRVVAVAAYARHRVIGDHGRIPWHIPEDFAHFKRETMGRTMVMGRLTYDSIGRPLPGRRTIVVTRNPDWAVDGVEVAHSLEAAMSLADPQADLVVAGGAQVYAEAMPLLTHQVLTEVDLEVGGDAFYPDFDRSAWRETWREAGPGCTWVWWERA